MKHQQIDELLEHLKHAEILGKPKIAIKISPHRIFSSNDTQIFRSRNSSDLVIRDFAPEQTSFGEVLKRHQINGEHVFLDFYDLYSDWDFIAHIKAKVKTCDSYQIGDCPNTKLLQISITPIIRQPQFILHKWSLNNADKHSSERSFSS